MSIKQLKQRWLDHPDLARAAFSWLGDTTQELPAEVAAIDGRVDLRGLPTFPEGTVRQIADTRWEHLDLSRADLSGLRLTNVDIADCLFENANLQQLVFERVTCTRTSLAGADLEQTSFGGLAPGSEIVCKDVDFSKAKMRRRFIVGATLDTCTFRDTKLKAAEFYRCLITDSVFATDMTEVMFEGRRMGMAKERPFPEYEQVPLRRVDFSESTFFYTAIRECAVEDVIWPDDPKIHILPVPSARVDRALAWLDARGDRDNTAAAKGLRRMIDEASTNLTDGSRFIVVNLAESEGPRFTDDLPEALFGTGQGE